MSDIKDDLTSGLVGERRELYFRNAHFHHTVNQLACMLPLWVDALAVDAMTRADREQAAICSVVHASNPLLRKDTTDE